MIKLHLGECLPILKLMPDNSVDSIVTDPPYGLSKQPDMVEVMRHWMAGDDYQHTGSGFMGKAWDSFVPGPSVWRECLRVLKPGGYLLAFSGSRTYDLMALAVRLAGFEIRDQLMWVYGSGFPKSLDVSKAIDKAAGELSARGKRFNAAGCGESNGKSAFRSDHPEFQPYEPATEDAQQWQGWGTALKPAHEPIVMARKPLIGTVAANILEHGVGALNIDGCRIEGRERTSYGLANSTRTAGSTYGKPSESADFDSDAGRWPANFLHDGSEEVTDPLGDAARYFYCAKAGSKDRNEGCDHLTNQSAGEMTGGREEGSAGLNSPRAGAGRTSGAKNIHPTVKPTELMRWLVRLVTPPGGTVLDPFMGSGSTGKAAIIEGAQFVGIEMGRDYMEIAHARISHAANGKERVRVVIRQPANDNADQQAAANA